MENKKYITCSLVDNPEIFQRYVDNYLINDDILNRLAKDLGFSYELYNTLSVIDQATADSLVVSMSRKSKHTEISLLVDEGTSEVIGYSLEYPRVPLLNENFMKRVTSLVETSKEIKISEKYLYHGDTISSVIIKKVEPIVIDSGNSQTSYDVGVLLVNNELDSAYCRLVVFIDNQPYYLPASHYSATTNRYKKSTSNTEEALEVLVLKIIDDLRDEALKYKLTDFHVKYKWNKEVLTTYEEYNTILRTMIRIPSIAEDRSVLESLSSRYEEFEKKYAHLDDQKGSYIWRCTAIGDLTIGSLVHITSKILNDLGAPSIEYYNIRELIGSYLSTNRVVTEIAKETI